jgi:hypothetical protein
MPQFVGELERVQPLLVGTIDGFLGIDIYREGSEDNAEHH